MAKRKKRGPLAELGCGLRKMTPNRMLARFASGGKHQTLGAIARAGMKAPGPQSVPMRPVPWGSPLPTSDAAANRARTAAARKQPAKKATVRKTAAKKTAAGKVQVPKRKADGTFDGSVSFPTFGPREQAMYERGLTGWVDPGQQLRQPRRSR